ncbi:hypothetical protein Pcinc_015296 [Petrolisthes cinctipes]|uniref:Tudor domain-containing protein n=1 Tax=Petrolisthes cinctipes TaxID=88211 RepID=A0AAE1FUT1_PETCI|nr:hypothetical protein Pcinc_015296 [Petrolisthes cinctipes]
MESSEVPSHVTKTGELYPKLDIKKVLELGELVKVVVGEVYTPYHFWVIPHGRNNSNALDALMDQMYEFYSGHLGEQYQYVMSQSASVVGAPVVALYSDDMSYYRAIITSPPKNSGMVNLFFVDYGTVYNCDISFLRHIHNKFIALPAQAVKASLFDVKPVERNSTWGFCASRRFLEIVQNRNLVAKVIHFKVMEDKVHLELWDMDQDIRIGALLVQEGWATSLLDEMEYAQQVCKLHLQNSSIEDPNIDKQSSASACCEKSVNVGKASTSRALTESELNGSYNSIDLQLKSNGIGMPKIRGMEDPDHTRRGSHPYSSSLSFMNDNVLDLERMISKLKSSLSELGASDNEQNDHRECEEQNIFSVVTLLTKVSELFAAVFELQVHKLLGGSSTDKVQPKQVNKHCGGVSECHSSHCAKNDIDTLQAIQFMSRVNEPSSLEDAHSSDTVNESFLKAMQSTGVVDELTSLIAIVYSGMASKIFEYQNSREENVLQCTDISNESLQCQNTKDGQISRVCKASECLSSPPGSPTQEKYEEICSPIPSNETLPVSSSSVNRSLETHLGLNKHINHTSNDNDMSANNVKCCQPRSPGYHLENVTKCKQESPVASSDILPRYSSSVVKDHEPNIAKTSGHINCSTHVHVNSSNFQSEISQYAVNLNNLKSAPCHDIEHSTHEDVNERGLESMRDMCPPQKMLPKPPSVNDVQDIPEGPTVNKGADGIFHSDGPEDEMEFGATPHEQLFYTTHVIPKNLTENFKLHVVSLHDGPYILSRELSNLCLQSDELQSCLAEKGINFPTLTLNMNDGAELFLQLLKYDCVWVYDETGRLLPQLVLYCLKTLPAILYALGIQDAELVSAVLKLVDEYGEDVNPQENIEEGTNYKGSMSTFPVQLTYSLSPAQHSSSASPAQQSLSCPSAQQSFSLSPAQPSSSPSPTQCSSSPSPAQESSLSGLEKTFSLISAQNSSVSPSTGLFETSFFSAQTFTPHSDETEESNSFISALQSFLFKQVGSASDQLKQTVPLPGQVHNDQFTQDCSFSTQEQVDGDLCNWAQCSPLLKSMTFPEETDYPTKPSGNQIKPSEDLSKPCENPVKLSEYPTKPSENLTKSYDPHDGNVVRETSFNGRIESYLLQDLPAGSEIDAEFYAERDNNNQTAVKEENQEVMSQFEDVGDCSQTVTAVRESNEQIIMTVKEESQEGMSLFEDEDISKQAVTTGRDGQELVMPYVKQESMNLDSKFECNQTVFTMNEEREEQVTTTMKKSWEDMYQVADVDDCKQIIKAMKENQMQVMTTVKESTSQATVVDDCKQSVINMRKSQENKSHSTTFNYKVAIADDSSEPCPMPCNNTVLPLKEENYADAIINPDQMCQSMLNEVEKYDNHVYIVEKLVDEKKSLSLETKTENYADTQVSHNRKRLCLRRPFEFMPSGQKTYCRGIADQEVEKNHVPSHQVSRQMSRSEVVAHDLFECMTDLESTRNIGIQDKQTNNCSLSKNYKSHNDAEKHYKNGSLTKAVIKKDEQFRKIQSTSLEKEHTTSNTLTIKKNLSSMKKFVPSVQQAESIKEESCLPTPMKTLSAVQVKSLKKDFAEARVRLQRVIKETEKPGGYQSLQAQKSSRNLLPLRNSRGNQEIRKLSVEKCNSTDNICANHESYSNVTQSSSSCNRLRVKTGTHIEVPQSSSYPIPLPIWYKTPTEFNSAQFPSSSSSRAAIGFNFSCQERDRRFPGTVIKTVYSKRECWCDESQAVIKMDHSIVTGLGRTLALGPEDVTLMYLDEPQATSTVANKKTREELEHQYIATLEEEREGSRSRSGGFQRLRARSSAHTAVHLVAPNTMVEGSNQRVSGEDQESSSLGSMGTVQLINVDSMSGLSSSRFLVDHTQIHQLPPELLDTSPPNTAPASPTLHTTPTKTSSSLASADSPLSTGELTPEDLINVPGLDPKYLEHSPEVLRWQESSLVQDHSFPPSLQAHQFEEEEVEEEISGLPVSMVKPQHLPPEDHSLLAEVERSKLLSNSCNSLGSIGLQEFDPDTLELSQEAERGKHESDWFAIATEQGELASMMDGEEFKTPDEHFFEVEELLHHEEHRFEQGGSSLGEQLDFSNFSGIHGVTEITVRSSLLPSPYRSLVGENNKIVVEEYLRSRSETLGTLGSRENRPNFGTTVHSPPPPRPPRLLYTTLDDTSEQDSNYEGSSGTIMHCSSDANKSIGVGDKVPENRQQSVECSNRSGGTMDNTNSSSSGDDKEQVSHSILSQPMNTKYKNPLKDKYRNLETTNASHGMENYTPGSEVKRTSLGRHMENIHAYEIGSYSNPEQQVETKYRKFMEDESRSNWIGASEGHDKYTPRNELKIISPVEDIKDKQYNYGRLGTSQLPDVCVPSTEGLNEAESSLLQRTLDMERSLKDPGGKVDVEKITSLLKEAQDNPYVQTLITRILVMQNEKLSVSHSTMDITNLELSTEVLNLRQQKEALRARHISNPGQKKQSFGKENVLKVTKSPDRTLGNRCVSDKNMSKSPKRIMVHSSDRNMNQSSVRKMTHSSEKKLQQTSAQEVLLAVPRKHMEKLKAERTNSDPGVLALNQTKCSHSEENQGNTRVDIQLQQQTKHIQFKDKLEDTNVDSIKKAQYRSKILEDTARLQLPEFHGSKGIGVDSSTPCQSHVRLPQDMYRTGGDTLQTVCHPGSRRSELHTAIQSDGSASADELGQRSQTHSGTGDSKGFLGVPSTEPPTATPSVSCSDRMTGRPPQHTTKKPQPRMGVLGQGRGGGKGTETTALSNQSGQISSGMAFVKAVPRTHTSQTHKLSSQTSFKHASAPHSSHAPHTNTFVPNRHTTATVKAPLEPDAVFSMKPTTKAKDNHLELKAAPRETRPLPVNTPASSLSTSVPTGLHSLGMGRESAGTATMQSSVPTSALRQHHSHENVSRTTSSLADVCVPEQVSLGQMCVLGMATYTTFTLHNPHPRWTHFSLRLLKESVDGAVRGVSALLFRPSYFLEPGGTCEAKLGVCGQFKGHLEATVEVRLTDLVKGDSSGGPCEVVTISHLGNGSSSHFLTVSAIISEPEVKVKCESDGNDRESILDFGVVAEGCVVSRQVTLTNQSPQTLPVILHLQQVAVTSPIFYWDTHKNSSGQTVSLTCLACELPTPADIDSQPAPVTVTITFKAPHLDNVEVDESGVVEVRSTMQVEMDVPDQSKIIISSFPIKASIGEVCLESQRVCEPLTLEAASDTSPQTSITLKSSSTFPLRVSLAVREHKDVFSVHPAALVIQPHSYVSPAIIFSPHGWVGRVESYLVIRIEPEGMDFEISIAGVSYHTQPHLPPPQPAGHPHLGKTPMETAASFSHHAALAKCNSEPMEDTPARVLESTKSRLVFGTVAVGGSSGQKLVLRNTSTSHKLSLSLTILGSEDFQMQGSRQSRLEVVLEPCQELPLTVTLRPSDVQPLSATLVCKYRSITNPFKCRIPLQGYGGQGKLSIPDYCQDLPCFVLQSLTPGLPSLVRTPFVNTGSRTIFVKIQIFTDKECTTLVTPSDISVQPSRFVLGPEKESQDVYLVANGTPTILALAQGTLGYMHVITGDEILRQRYKRLKNKEVKVRRMNDPTLLGVDLVTNFSREDGALKDEPDTLPPQPEDAMVFLNSCHKMIMEVYGERQANADDSDAAFAVLDPEDTMSSMIDLSVGLERTSGSVSTLLSSTQACHIQPQPPPPPSTSHHTTPVVTSTHISLPPLTHSTTTTPPTKMTTNTSWNVVPPSLVIPASDTTPREFFVVNFGTEQQTFEVRSFSRDLQVTPSEALLAGQSSVRVCVSLLTPQRALTTPCIHTIKFLGENDSCTATVTILPTRDDSKLQPFPSHPPPISTHHYPSASSFPPLSSSLQPPTPSFPPSASSVKGRKEVTPVNQQTSLVSKTSSSRQHGTYVGDEVKEDLVRVLVDAATFPDTAAGKESIIKVKLTNQDTDTRTVRSAVTPGAFFLRHPEFQVKSGHFSSLPVYFRPSQPGLHTAQLHLTILATNTKHTVQLSGMAMG